MFKSAVVKLTLLYVAIIGVICLYFSLNLYDISTKELERGLRAQQKRLNMPRPGRIIDEKKVVDDELETVLSSGKARIISRLIFACMSYLVTVPWGFSISSKQLSKTTD